MAREADDGELLVRLVKVEREQKATNMLLLEVLTRLQRARIGDQPTVPLAPFMRLDDGN